MGRMLLPTLLITLLSFQAGCASTRRPVTQRVVDTTLTELRAARESAVEVLLVLAEDVRPLVRANAIEALVGAPAEGSSVIEDGLRDTNEGVRSVSAMIAGRLKLQSAAGWLRPLVLDESPFVRASAIYALDRIGESVDPTPISAMLFDSKSPMVRAHAAFVLGEMGAPSAVEMLRQANQDGMPRASTAEVRLLRLQIAEAMIKLGDDEPISGVYAALFPSRPEEFELAALAIQIIGEVGDRKAIDQLIYLASGQEELAMPPEIRLAAADALAKLGLPQGGFIADGYAQDSTESVRSYAALVYGRTDAEGNLGKALGMLQDRSPIVRAAAASAVLELTASID